MLKRILLSVLVCAMLIMPVAALAGTYDDIDPSVVIGAENLSWVTIVGVNDTPFDNNSTTADIVFLDNTGTKIALPEDSTQWVAWMDDICVNQTGGKGDLAFAKKANEKFLRVAYDFEGNGFLYMDYTRKTYEDWTRVMIRGTTGYIKWSTGNDKVQRGAKAVYDNETGLFTVTEFNMLSMDESIDDVMAAAYFDMLQYTCNFKVNTQDGNLLLRAEPSSKGEVLARIPKGGEIDFLYNYTYKADNGYDYMPVAYSDGNKTHYGWVARDYLGINENVDSVTWVGPKPVDLEYPSPAEFRAAEGTDDVTFEVTVTSKPKKGDAYKEGEKINFTVKVTNNTFANIEPAVFTGTGIENAMLSMPWRRSVVTEGTYTVTAEDAAAQSVNLTFALNWVTAAGAGNAVSEPVTVPTV